MNPEDGRVVSNLIVQALAKILLSLEKVIKLEVFSMLTIWLRE